MRTIFFLLFFLSSFAYAEFIEIDPTQSSLVVFDKKVPFSGYMNREESKFEIQSDDVNFSGDNFSGGEDEFEVEGTLTYNGQSRGIKLVGKSYGNSIYHFKNSELDMRLVGLKTKDEKNNMIKAIQEIVE